MDRDERVRAVSIVLLGYVEQATVPVCELAEAVIDELEAREAIDDVAPARA